MINIARLLNDIPGISFALNFLGVTSLFQSKFTDAEGELREAYELAHRTGIAWIACSALGRLTEYSRS